MREAGVECAVFKGDVASPEDVQVLFEGVGEHVRAAGHLVNNAGSRATTS